MRRIASTLVGLAGIVTCQAAQTPPQGTLELIRRSVVGGTLLSAAHLEAIIADDDGTIYVADIGAQQLVRVDPEGDSRIVIAGPGDGPREYRGLRGTLAWVDGILYAHDFRQQAILMYDAGDSIVGSIPWANGRYGGSLLLGGGDALYAREVVYPASKNAPLLREFVAFGRFPTHARRELPSLRGTMPRPGADCESRDGMIHVLRAPFTDWYPKVAFLPRGRVAIVDDDGLLRVFELATGEVVTEIGTRTAPVEITDERWESLDEVQQYRMASERAPGELFAAGSDFRQPCPVLDDRPSHFPAVRSLIADSTGRLWVEQPTETGYKVRVVTTDGEALGEAPMPARDVSVPFYVRGNLMYLVTRDQLGVQEVEVYEIGGLGR